MPAGEVEMTMYPFPEHIKTDKEDEQLSVHFSIPEDYPYFEGHFPSNPLVPAVIQIGWVISSVSLLREEELKGYQLSRFKFLLPIRPLDEIHVTVEGTGNGYRCAIRRGEELCSSGKIILDSND
jgi:3-hydroxymyristoyl/3-hydroxydecanoyl-(acyl carrier protein) dehydratase